jgi:hypothetical protein
MKRLFYTEKNNTLKVGTIEGTPLFMWEDNNTRHTLSKCILVDDQIGVMFPSDLQDTNLEDIWVDGYDSILEENQDRYMNDFWKWCETNCTSTLLRNGHVSFDFVA